MLESLEYIKLCYNFIFESISGFLNVMIFVLLCYLIYMIIFYEIRFSKSIRQNRYLFNFLCHRRYSSVNEPERQLYIFYGIPS